MTTETEIQMINVAREKLTWSISILENILLTIHDREGSTSDGDHIDASIAKIREARTELERIK